MAEWIDEHTPGYMDGWTGGSKQSTVKMKRWDNNQTSLINLDRPRLIRQWYIGYYLYIIFRPIKIS